MNETIFDLFSSSDQTAFVFHEGLRAFIQKYDINDVLSLSDIEEAVPLLVNGSNGAKLNKILKLDQVLAPNRIVNVTEFFGNAKTTLSQLVEDANSHQPNRTRIDYNSKLLLNLTDRFSDQANKNGLPFESAEAALVFATQVNSLGNAVRNLMNNPSAWSDNESSSDEAGALSALSELAANASTYGEQYALRKFDHAFAEISSVDLGILATENPKQGQSFDLTNWQWRSSRASECR